MPLIKCDKCGQMMSDKAAACPHCGNVVGRSVPPTVSGSSPKANPIWMIAGAVMFILGLINFIVNVCWLIYNIIEGYGTILSYLSGALSTISQFICFAAVGCIFLYMFKSPRTAVGKSYGKS